VDLASNDSADANVIVDSSLDWGKQEELVCGEVDKILKGEKLEAILNMAGENTLEIS
jgi:hypothetical protein